MTQNGAATSGRPRWTLIATVLAGVAVTLAVVVLLTRSSLGGRMGALATASAVHTVTEGEFAARVPASGELEAASSLSIAVPAVNTGSLTIFWLIRDGTVVQQGDTLVEFDGSELTQQLEEAENTIEAALRELDASVLRGNSDTAGLVADHNIAGMELEKAHTQAPRDAEIFSRNEIREGALDVDLATTRTTEYAGKIDTSRKIEDLSQRILVIDRSKHEVRRGQLTDSLSRLKVLAPRDGLVLVEKDNAGNSVTVGESRSPGFVLMTMPETSSMKARVQVLEADAGMVKVGQSATVTVDSHPNRPFDAIVERVDAIARPLDKDIPVKYFEVVLQVEGDAPDILKPGKLVQARITTAQHDSVVAVPRVAIVEGDDSHSVWVVNGGGSQRRTVEVAPGDHANMIVTAGLSAGDRVRLDPPLEGP